MLYRHPTATNAYELGFAPGIREDYTYQIENFPNVSLPVIILDNDFRDPNVNRYLEQFERYDPSVAILGDAYTPSEAKKLNALAVDLKDKYPYKEFVVVPKCRKAFDILDDEIVLGYPIGYSDIQAMEFSNVEDWRGRRIHLLGASPPKQYAVIEELTQPTLFDEPPADIVGLDWNGVQKVAYKGEYWSREGWQRADHLSIQNTVRKSLQEIKQFWEDRGVWSEMEPIDLCGPAVREPDDPLFAVNGADITTREDLETAIVVDYNDCTLAYRTETEQAFLEWREGRISR